MLVQIGYYFRPSSSRLHAKNASFFVQFHSIKRKHIEVNPTGVNCMTAHAMPGAGYGDGEVGSTSSFQQFSELPLCGSWILGYRPDFRNFCSVHSAGIINIAEWKTLALLRLSPLLNNVQDGPAKQQQHTD